MSCVIFFSRKHFQCLNVIFRSRSETDIKTSPFFQRFRGIKSIFYPQTNSWDIWFQFGPKWHRFFNWVLNREKKHPPKTHNNRIDPRIQMTESNAISPTSQVIGRNSWERFFSHAWCLSRCPFNVNGWLFWQVYSPTPDFVSGVALNLGCTSMFFLQISQKVMVGSVENDPKF